VHLRTFLDQALASAAPSRKKGSETQMAAIAEMLIGLARDNRESVRFFLSHIFAPDADRPPSSTDQCMQEPSRLIHQIAATAVHSGELAGDPSELERLVFGAVQYSIIRHLRSPAEEPLEPGLGQRIVRAAVRGFFVRASAQPAAPAVSAAVGPARHSAATPSHADADPV
jgi:hypothetical protein